MTTLEHKKYGTVGGEFIVHHRTLKPKRLVVSLLVTSTLAAFFQVYEMDVVVLWSGSLCLVVLLLYRLLYKVSKEVLLVVPSVGVQVNTDYWLGGRHTRFFQSASVKGIVITEAVTMHSVLCYLAILLTSASSHQTQQVFPLFTQSYPCQSDLIYIYQAVQAMQWNSLPSSSSPPSPTPPTPSAPPTSPAPHEGTDSISGKTDFSEEKNNVANQRQSIATRTRKRTRLNKS